MEHPKYKNLIVHKDGKIIYEGEELKQYLDKRGYCKVFFINICRVHRLVAETYIPNPKNKRTVDHIDQIKTNNNVENLRWATDCEQCKNRPELPRNYNKTPAKNISININKKRNGWQRYCIHYQRNGLRYQKYMSIDTPLEDVIKQRDLMLSMF